MEFDVRETLQRGLFAGNDRFRLELDGDFTVVAFTLAEPALDLYTLTMVPAGTEVVAPVLVVPINEVPGVATFNQEDPADWPPQVVGSRAWVYCHHDFRAYGATAAQFYRRQDLERVVRSEARLGTMMFDPITYGTGRTALLFHAAATVSAAARQHAVDAFMRTRGPAGYLQAGRMGSVRLPAEGRQRPRGIPRELIFASSIEQTNFLSRIVAAMRQSPRVIDTRMPESSLSIPKSVLPFGINQNLCLDGITVQSAAAWSVRRDWRVAEFFGTPDGENLPLDLPLRCWTGESYRDSFLGGGEPILAVPNPAQVRTGITRAGGVCLGLGTVPVWTLAPGQEIPAAILSSRFNDMPATFALPTQFRVNGTGPITPVNSRAQLIDRLAAVNLTRASVEMDFPVVGTLRFNYAACTPGYAYAFDPRTDPIINLPPLSPPVAELTVVVPIALMVTRDEALLREMHTRIMRGQSPITNLWGGALRTDEAAEVARVQTLRPLSLPYTLQGSRPEAWDNREQNPLYGLPYIHSQHSPKLLAQIRSAY